MFYILPVLCSLALVALLLFWIFVLPIWAFQRTRILTRRVSALEAELRHLRRGAVLEPVLAPAASAPVEVLPGAPPASAPEPDIPPAAPVARDWGNIEAWLGRRGLGWAAVLLLFFAGAFFLNYAFENEWIGEQGQVCIGLALGLGLCYAGYRQHHAGMTLFGQMLIAAGIVLLYLATFATFGFFHLVSVQVGGLFLLILVAETLLLALLYRSYTIALMAVIGGLLTPLLLSTGSDNYLGLFAYLLILNAGVLALTLAQPFPGLSTLTLVGTQLLFWGWFSEFRHPEKIPAALGFQLLLWLLHLGQGLFLHLVRLRRASAEDLLRQTLLAILLAGAGAGLLWEDFEPWLGTLALLLACVYTGLTWLMLWRRPDDIPLLLTFLAVALAAVAVVFPLQTNAVWVSLGWAVEGLALWWFGLRIRRETLRGMGLAFLSLAVVRLLFIDTPYLRRDWFLPIFNVYALPALAVAVCVLLAAEASRRFRLRPDSRHPWTPQGRVLQAVLGLGGVLLVWFILSRDVYDAVYYWARDPQYYYSPDQQWLAQTALSALWAGYAVVVVLAGLRLNSEPLRWTGLGLFGLTLAKVLLYDTSGLTGLYRVVTFAALAVLMGAAGWGYQKYLGLTGAKKEVGGEA